MSASTRIAFYTLGCKVNQAETDALARAFEASDFQTVAFDALADVYVINTCTVTHVGDSKSRQILRQAKRANPDALVVATGCYASVRPEDAGSEGTLVVRNRDKHNLVPIVMQAFEASRQTADSPDVIKHEMQGFTTMTPGRRTRAMVKAQDGCDSMCAYCIIPRARGRSRSVPPQAVIAEVDSLVAQGHGEVVITGVDLGSYGEDRPDYPDLGGLLAQVLDSTRVCRVRVSSVEPGDFNPAWLDLWHNRRLCRHLHVPLQAGSDAVLQRMRRKYDTAGFREMLSACRVRIPGVTITTDMMVGFPGESDAEFEDGMAFAAECAFDGMHVFQYSRRSGTAASRMDRHIPERVKKERSARLRLMAEAGQRELVKRSLGAEVDVLWESNKDGVWRGISDTNIRVYSSDSDLRSGVLEKRRVSAAYRDGVWGQGFAASGFNLEIMPAAPVS